jgi:DNA (cytosine-5)-methyltransferase 1
MPVSDLTHVSLFTGIAGIDLAAEAAGFETTLQVEIADYQRALLYKHWPNVPKIKDIRELTLEKYNELTRGNKGGDKTGVTEGFRPPTVLSGGFPC